MIWVLLIFLFIWPLDGGAKDTLKVAAIDWCPQICPDQKSHPGYLVEILRAVFDDSPYEVRMDYLSWSSAITKVQRGQYDILLSPAKSEAPQLIYHAEPISQQMHCLWHLKSYPGKIKKPEDLKKIRFVIYRDHSLPEALGEVLKTPSGHLSLNYDHDYLERAIRLLRKNRAQAFVFTAQSVQYHLKKNKITDIKQGVCFRKDDLWFGITPVPDPRIANLIKHIDSRLGTFKRSVEYQKILLKYDIQFPELTPW
ncbi:substrate-binding periplasmic protein [Bdellovibrio bacteriovorus]|uniref:substrate-binding periplasmic protein n=1 Tax=Bdellovibrio bacteriovorus TaxID=959 RepID=UPI003CFEFC98